MSSMPPPSAECIDGIKRDDQLAYTDLDNTTPKSINNNQLKQNNSEGKPRSSPRSSRRRDILRDLPKIIEILPDSPSSPIALSNSASAPALSSSASIVSALTAPPQSLPPVSTSTSEPALTMMPLSLPLQGGENGTVARGVVEEAETGSPSSLATSAKPAALSLNDLNDFDNEAADSHSEEPQILKFLQDYYKPKNSTSSMSLHKMCYDEDIYGNGSYDHGDDGGGGGEEGSEDNHDDYTDGDEYSDGDDEEEEGTSDFESDDDHDDMAESSSFFSNMDEDLVELAQLSGLNLFSSPSNTKKQTINTYKSMRRGGPAKKMLTPERHYIEDGEVKKLFSTSSTVSSPPLSVTQVPSSQAPQQGQGSAPQQGPPPAMTVQSRPESESPRAQSLSQSSLFLQRERPVSRPHCESRPELHEMVHTKKSSPHPQPHNREIPAQRKQQQPNMNPLHSHRSPFKQRRPSFQRRPSWTTPMPTPPAGSEVVYISKRHSAGAGVGGSGQSRCGSPSSLSSTQMRAASNFYNGRFADTSTTSTSMPTINNSTMNTPSSPSSVTTGATANTSNSEATAPIHNRLLFQHHHQRTRRRTLRRSSSDGEFESTSASSSAALQQVPEEIIDHHQGRRILRRRASLSASFASSSSAPAANTISNYNNIISSSEGADFDNIANNNLGTPIRRNSKSSHNCNSRISSRSPSPLHLEQQHQQQQQDEEQFHQELDLFREPPEQKQQQDEEDEDDDCKVYNTTPKPLLFEEFHFDTNLVLKSPLPFEVSPSRNRSGDSSCLLKSSLFPQPTHSSSSSSSSPSILGPQQELERKEESHHHQQQGGQGHRQEKVAATPLQKSQKSLLHQQHKTPQPLMQHTPCQAEQLQQQQQTQLELNSPFAPSPNTKLENKRRSLAAARTATIASTSNFSSSNSTSAITSSSISTPSKLRSSCSLSSFVKDRRREDEIHAMLASVEQGSTPRMSHHGRKHYGIISFAESTNFFMGGGSSAGNGGATSSSASSYNGSYGGGSNSYSGNPNEPGDTSVSVSEVGVGSGSGYIRSMTNTSVSASGGAVGDTSSIVFDSAASHVSLPLHLEGGNRGGGSGNNDFQSNSNNSNNNHVTSRENAFYPNDNHSPSEANQNESVPKQFTIRQFPNGDLFSGNVHAETQELIYGRMTYALDMEVYEGPFLHGKRHGEGAVCMKMDGAGKFLGRYHEGQMHSGTLIVSRNSPSDFTYTGSFLNNDFHGEGTIATSNGTIYKGQFAHGQFHGTGTLHDGTDESVYTGDFAEGLFHGSGTMVYADGSKYAGTWYQGCRVEGTEILANGDVFEGSFRDNAREGRGTLKSKTSKITTSGVWNKNALVEGVNLSITFADGHRYDGDHVHSRPHGYGRMIYADFGSGAISYIGQFMNGFRNGDGRCIFHKSGEEYDGEWICDEPADLKLFQHNGPLCEKNGVQDLQEEDVVYSSIKTTTSSSSLTSLISEDSTMNTTVTSYGGPDKITKKHYQHNSHRRRRRSSHQKRHVDFDPASSLNDSMISLNFLDFASDTPKLYRYQNGDVFKGHLDKNNLRQGPGVYTEHRMGSVYDGDWKDSMRHGVGLLTLASGVEYSGEFFKDRIHGQGTLILIDASVYTGGFFNGLFHGHGTLEDVSNNRTYFGEFEKGLRHGEGDEKYADGQRYRGEFKNGKRHGRGTLRDADGHDIYRGEWRDDHMHGKGLLLHHELQNTNWQGYYEGDFVRGKFCGNGAFTYTDGTRIEGQWLDAVPRDGDWTINYPDGSKFYGFATFRHPEEEKDTGGEDDSPDASFLRVPLPHGFGTLTYSSGKRYIGAFVYGECEDSLRNSA